MYLSSATTQALLLTVKCNSLYDVHHGHTHAEPLHLQSKVQRHKEVSEKILWDGSYKRTNCHRVKESPFLKGAKHLSRNLIFFDQSVEVKLAPSLYFLKFSFL